MSRVVVLATGGTIASRSDAAGDVVAQDGGAQLLERARLEGVATEVVDLFRVGSNLMTFPMTLEVALRARQELDRPDVDGLVVTHGTDTLEETAFLLELCVPPDKPVVVTGAQRAADQVGSDGPRHVTDAVLAAAAPVSRGRGTLVGFDGGLFPAWGVRKLQTLASSAFDSPERGQVGFVRGGVVGYVHHHEPTPRLDPRLIDPARARVDIVTTYPGVDGTAIDAYVAAGARGLVVEGMGGGNTNADVSAAVARAHDAGVVVLLASRVPFGPVTTIYGGAGGGADLARAGALPTGLLKSTQARVLLAALLGATEDPAEVRDWLTGRFSVFLT